MTDEDAGTVGQCECNVPTLEVERSHVGNWYVQIVFCVECTTKLDVSATHQAVIDGAAEPDPADLPAVGEVSDS